MNDREMDPCNEMESATLAAKLVRCTEARGQGTDGNTGWASGAWFIGPDGSTLAQMPASTQRGDSKEFILIYNVPIK